MDTFLRGQSNFETVVASQNCFFGKVGMGYNPSTKKRPFASFFENKKIST